MMTSIVENNSHLCGKQKETGIPSAWYKQNGTAGRSWTGKTRERESREELSFDPSPLRGSGRLGSTAPLRSNWSQTRTQVPRDFDRSRFGMGRGECVQEWSTSRCEKWRQSGESTRNQRIGWSCTGTWGDPSSFALCVCVDPVKEEQLMRCSISALAFERDQTRWRMKRPALQRRRTRAPLNEGWKRRLSSYKHVYWTGQGKAAALPYDGFYFTKKWKTRTGNLGREGELRLTRSRERE